MVIKRKEGLTVYKSAFNKFAEPFLNKQTKRKAMFKNPENAQMLGKTFENHENIVYW